MVSGIDFNSNKAQLNCEVCHMGKICQILYKKSSNRAKGKLGLVHSNICGPMSTMSIGGSKYFVTFIDDYTKYMEVFMLKNRSEVLSVFRKYMLRVKRECGHGIKILHTDNAKEYISRELSKQLESEGIKHELTVPHTPQQNGVEERANRTLVEMARCMLLQSKMPMSLWAEAINTANFIRNRCPTKALDNKTLLEMWSKPYVRFMRTFECKAISLIKGTNKSKFKAKGKSMIMVGYSSESKAYRLWQPKTIFKSRDVRFLENAKPDSNQVDKFLEVPMNLNEEIISNYDASETESTEEREETYDTPDDDVEVIDSQPMKSRETCDTPRGIINEDDDLHEEKSTSSLEL
ncbi:retrovirus-related pol polyprotein from transposon tnt 1-94, partial [Lasius niger]